MSRIKDTCYLVMSEYGIQRMTKRQGGLKRGEVAVRVALIVPEKCFAEPDIGATAVVPESAVILPNVSVEVVEPEPPALTASTGTEGEG